MQARIRQDEDQLGFVWLSPAGEPTDLAAVLRSDDEPDRLPPTHLSALDDALIDIAGRFGELLGGGRAAVLAADRANLAAVAQVLDRLIGEYAAAVADPDVRGGQIIGTAALIAIRARMALGCQDPVPLDGELDDPGTGVVPGFGRLRYADPSVPWRGARWVVESPNPDGPLFPLTLSMLLHASSGVLRDSALDEHRAALDAVSAAAADPAADPVLAGGAVQWLLYDWLMANREDAGSGAITIHSKFPKDAAMIVGAAAAMVRCRAVITPGYLDPVPLFAR
jgi:hypothetical protein